LLYFLCQFFENRHRGKAGPVVTAGGLIFISGTEDKKLRALDKSRGKLLWETTLPALANATACTYQVKGKQYVAIQSEAQPKIHLDTLWLLHYLTNEQIS
jgi:glucose dehydrogenase